MNSVISVQSISKKFGALEVLNDVSFELPAGKVLAVIGPSGSGKTTLLRCLNFLTRIDSGTVRVGDFTITAEPATFDSRALRKKVGMVAQQFHLWPHKTVMENLTEAPIFVLGLSKDQAEAKAKELLERIGLTEKAGEYPSRLSGGQQQRVAIARALAMDPEVLLFDEITSSLDPELVGEVLSLVKEIATERDRTIVIATHEMGFARDVADEVIFMDNGAVVESGKPEQIFRTPQKERTKKFLSRALAYDF